MITWLQNFFLKHNKWLFGGLLIVIIVTFVLTIGPQSFFGSGGGPQREALKYYGYDLSSPSDQQAISFKAEVSAILHPDLQVRRDQLMDYAYMRVAALGIAEQLGIPRPGQESLKEYIATLTIFQDPQTGEFSADTYRTMLDALQNSARYDRDSVAMVIREDYRIAKVRDALGGPAYFLPYEMEQDFIDRQSNYDLALARFDYADFEPAIDPSEEALRQFYRENPARYEIPETINVKALRFSGEAYVDEVEEPGEDALQAWFDSRRDQYTPESEESTDAGEAAGEDSEGPEVTLDAVREEVVADWKLEQATRIAAKKSEQFSLRIWQESILLDSDTFNQLLDEFEASVVDVPPYSREQAPQVGNIPQELLDTMWIYTSNPNRYFSDIAQTSDGAVILVTSGVTESRMPAFEEVREAVAADFRQTEKRRLFAEKGQELRESLKDALASSSFTEAAESLGLEVEDLEPFEGTSVPSSVRMANVWEQARYLNTGELTTMVISGNQGTFAYVQEKTTPEVDTDSEAYQDYLAQRTGMLNTAMGWARLREITDQSLNALLGTGIIQ